MSDGIVIDADEARVVARLTQKPFEYRVKIGHFAANGRYDSPNHSELRWHKRRMHTEAVTVFRWLMRRVWAQAATNGRNH